MSDHTIGVNWVLKTLFCTVLLYNSSFFVQFFCTQFFSVFLSPFLIFSAFVRSLPFLSFIEPIFAWNVPLVSLIFLKRSLSFPILLFPFISLCCSLKKAFSSLLAILWNSALSWVYLSLISLGFHFPSFLSHFYGLLRQSLCLVAFLFSLGRFWSLIPVQYL